MVAPQLNTALLNSVPRMIYDAPGIQARVSGELTLPSGT